MTVRRRRSRRRRKRRRRRTRRIIWGFWEKYLLGIIILSFHAVLFFN